MSTESGQIERLRRQIRRRRGVVRSMHRLAATVDVTECARHGAGVRNMAVWARTGFARVIVTELEAIAVSIALIYALQAQRFGVQPIRA